MASGLIRMRKGVERKLTRHELARGYIYISQDKSLYKIIDINDFQVKILDSKLIHRRIDVSGRVHIPASILVKIGTRQTIRISVTSPREVTIDCKTSL